MGQAEAFKNSFSDIPISVPNQSTFDLSHTVKMSFKMGYLVPCLCQEMLPNDYVTLQSETLIRLVPMLAPVMEKLNITIHHFFVPTRLLWPGWDRYITGSGIPGAHPYLWNDNGAVPLDVAPSSLANYLGLPVTNGISPIHGKINAIPFAAYFNVWFHWYRDQNIVDNMVEFPMLQDGEQTEAFTLDYLLYFRRRAWGRDMWTSCLPWAQKGDPVTIPMAFMSDKVHPRFDGAVTTPSFVVTNAAHTYPAVDVDLAAHGGDGVLNTTGMVQPFILDNTANIYIDPADFNLATTTTVNDMRKSTIMQKYLEKSARGGTRMTEYLRNFWNVANDDARLQRPELLGGSFNPFIIGEVLQTSETGVTEQGNMAGHGYSSSWTNLVKYHCKEHGTLLSIINVQPMGTYFQGIPKWFRKTDDRYQYALPDFDGLGEIYVQKEEVFHSGNSDFDKQPFGYLPIYYEYRHINNRVCGDMAMPSLEYWHMGRKFAGTQSLNADFIQAEVTRRIFPNTADDDKVIAMIHHNLIVRRSLSFYGAPQGL